MLYFPSGHYIVSDTLTLKPETVLVGLHPTLTQFDLPDGTKAYQGVGAPRAVISAPPGGSNILSGFGVLTGGINPRAVGVLWCAGAASLIDDPKNGSRPCALNVEVVIIVQHAQRRRGR